ncbi:dihydrofolate reductase [Rhodoligotrophos appendicifer]|uniref:dihydrofolate reductase n=1 Tax=Rhodoligotrophos appendicifer TaxID=987056 RepID=UPI00117FA62F|nr:dihydrofolate reductase [Rhodoligotrophos appendicifer]
MPQIRAMCAIGSRGQLGLKGQLPWEGRREPEFAADVARFFEETRGHVVLAGPQTTSAFPPWALSDRTVVELRSSMDPVETLSRFADRVVYIGGGPAVWDVYAPFIERWDITRLPYDGEADRWFDPAWLTRGK